MSSHLPESGNAPSCKLCGAPVYAKGEEFCCPGCARVYEILQNMSEEEGQKYIETAKRLGLIPGGEDEGAEGEPKELTKPIMDSEAVREEKFNIEGLFCPSCGWVAEQVLKGGEGIIDAKVDFFTCTASISYDMRLSSREALRERIAPFGYKLSEIVGEASQGAGRRATFDFIVCAVITMNLMSLSFVRYAEGLGWLDEAPVFIGWVEFLMALPVMYLGWLPMARRASAGLKSGRLTMDFLIGLAVASAFLLSTAALLMGRGEIYFETCCGLATISLLSGMVEARLRDRAAADISRLMRMKIAKARISTPEGEKYENIEAVTSGQTALFLEGEGIPFDGVVAGDEVMVSEAVLTGEPRPIKKVKGDMITAGSTLVGGRLELLIKRKFEETKLYNIAHSLTQTMSKNESRLRSADKIAAWFTPASLGVALISWGARFYLYGCEYALSADGVFPALAVLAVACPCAFSLAGVTAMTAAVGALLKKGFLIKDAYQLETLNKADTIVFDKTGTLTEGAMSVEKLAWRDKPREDLFSCVLAAEENSFHPAAEAIRGFLIERGATVEKSGCEAPIDAGGKGRKLICKGGELFVGAEALFNKTFAVNDIHPRHTVIWFGLSGEAIGCFLITDRIREGAKEAVAELKRMGYKTELLSGDRNEVAEWAAFELGIERGRGGLSIEDKVEEMKKLKEKGVLAVYVGDGTNDALAMSEAFASVAAGKSTDEALAAGGIALISGRDFNIPFLFKAASKLNSVVRGNYFWAFAYNSIFVPVAAAGKLTPLIAMLLMLVSSAAVLLNSLRVREIPE